MRFNYTYPVVTELSDVFYCRARRKDLDLEKCLNDYLEANAFDRRRSACFRCPQGRKNRESFASADLDEDAAEALADALSQPVPDSEVAMAMGLPEADDPPDKVAGG